MSFKPAKELVNAILAIAKAIKGESGGGSNEKSLGYFGLTNNPIGVIMSNLASPQSYDEEALIKIEDLVEQLGVPKRISPPRTFVFVYDKDVSNTVNFNTIQGYNTVITNGSEGCIELAPNRFCFSLEE